MADHPVPSSDALRGHITRLHHRGGWYTVPVDDMNQVLAALRRAGRLDAAVLGVLELYQDDPEYAAEWPALHHLRHVMAGEHVPECSFCAVDAAQFRFQSAGPSTSGAVLIRPPQDVEESRG